LAYRLLLLALILGTEVLVTSLAVDGAQISEGASGFRGALREWGAWGVRWTLAWAAIFSVFSFLGRGRETPEAAGRVGWGWLVGNGVVFWIFFLGTKALYEGGGGTVSWAGGLGWGMAGFGVVGTAVF